ncbi:hypothetical protein M758_UG010200 [Ceratodon purpureus]|nr:hypothetical protein M758_UG010200 [Ceratodon purpureus]
MKHYLQVSMTSNLLHKLLVSIHRLVVSVLWLVVSVHRLVISVHRLVLSVHRLVVLVLRLVVSVPRLVVSVLWLVVWVHTLVVSMHRLVISVQRLVVSVHKVVISVHMMLSILVDIQFFVNLHAKCIVKNQRVFLNRSTMLGILWDRSHLSVPSTNLYQRRCLLNLLEILNRCLGTRNSCLMVMTDTATNLLVKNFIAKTNQEFQVHYLVMSTIVILIESFWIMIWRSFNVGTLLRRIQGNQVKGRPHLELSQSW